MFFTLTSHRSDQRNTIGQLQTGFKALGKALLQTGLDLEAVDHHINLMLAFLVQGGHVVDVVNRAIDPKADKPLAAHGFDHLEVLAFPVTDYWCQDHQFAVLRHRQHLVHHLADGLCLQGLAVVRATGFAGPGEEQTEVVVNLGNGAHGGAGVVGSGFLFDGNGR